MNKAIKNLSPDNLLFVDLECAKQFKELDPKSEAFKVFQYKHRDKETEKLPSVAETQKLYDKLAALSPIFGRVVCASFGLYTNKGEVRIVSFSGEEKDLLKKSVDLIKKSKRALVGWNINGFDIPYMRKRCVINGLDFDVPMNDVDQKPWGLDQVSYDLMKKFQGTDPFRNSLDEVCLAFGIPSPKNTGVKGSEVSKAFHEGRIEELVNYCEHDVLACINVFRKFRGEPLLRRGC